MFFDLLNIKTPEWFQTFIDGRRLTSQSPQLLRAVPIFTFFTSVPQVSSPSGGKEGHITYRTTK